MVSSSGIFALHALCRQHSLRYGHTDSYSCLFVTEIKAHDDRKLWPKLNDPALEHPMSPRVLQILETYRQLYLDTKQEQPLMKLASFISPEEAMAAGEMGCHSATVSHEVLNKLKSLPYDGPKPPGKFRAKPKHVYGDGHDVPERLQKLLKTDPLGKWEPVRADVDYLANGGTALDSAIKGDPVVEQRLKDALELFTAAEERSKAKIEKIMTPA
jgi:transaldolase